jgi:hypothetical protein
MLDPFTQKAYEVLTDRNNPLVDALSWLPKEELAKIASGCFSDDHAWLERFEGTPLHEQAMGLLQEELQNEAMEMQQRQFMQQFYSAGDQLRMRKKMLELELAGLHSAATASADAPTGPAVMPPEVATPAPAQEAVQKSAEAQWLEVLVDSGGDKIAAPLPGGGWTAPKALLDAAKKKAVPAAASAPKSFSMTSLLHGPSSPAAGNLGMTSILKKAQAMRRAYERMMARH